MKVLRTYLQFSVLALLVVFISPVLVKSTHILYVHHEHHSKTSSDQHAYYEYHSVCPICAFKALDEIKNQVFSSLDKPEIVFGLLVIQNVVVADLVPVFLFNTRAPPVDTFFKTRY